MMRVPVANMSGIFISVLVFGTLYQSYERPLLILSGGLSTSSPVLAVRHTYHLRSGRRPQLAQHAHRGHARWRR